MLVFCVGVFWFRAAILSDAYERIKDRQVMEVIKAKVRTALVRVPICYF